MSLAEGFARDRRALILALLREQSSSGYELSARLIFKALKRIRVNVFEDIVEADIAFLASHGLVETSQQPIGGGLMGLHAALTRAGHDVANGREHPFVDPPDVVR